MLCSGCSNDNFFDISNCMVSPSMSDEQKNIINIVEKYLSSNFEFVYPNYEGKYSPEIDFSMGNELYKIFFCKIPFKDSGFEFHILLLKKVSENSWAVKSDFSKENFEVIKVDIVKEDGNEDFAKLIVQIENDNYENSIYTFKIYDDKILYH